jgi:outer membrane lipoprotein-sorting protein
MRLFLTHFILVLTLAGWAHAAPDDLEPEVAAFIDSVDKRAVEVETMQGSFIQRKEISLLMDSVVMEGTFFVKKGVGLHFLYEPKEDLYLTLKDKLVVAIQPEAKKASVVEVKRRHSNIMEKLLNDKLDSLAKYFDVTMADGEAGEKQLTLDPKRRRMKKRFNEIVIWVNQDLVINRIKVTLKDGDIHELIMKDIKINDPIDDALFSTEVPEGFQMDERMEFLFGAEAND